MSPMRVTAVMMVLLLASQAGAAIVCPAECMPAPMRVSAHHHSHEHHMLAGAPMTSLSTGPCGKLMVTESALANASRVLEFALEMPVAVTVRSSQLPVTDTISFHLSATEGSSPPKHSVLRI
jgi:hypothetical protein